MLYVNVFKPKDTRTIYNVIYRNGRAGNYYMKRFAVTGITRDKEYDLTPGLPGSKIMWFDAPILNGEAEVVKVILKPKAKTEKSADRRGLRAVEAQKAGARWATL